MSTHTPGPWRVFLSNGWPYQIAAESRSIVNWGSFTKSSQSESLANANLIAAAPEYWDAAAQMATDAGELEGDDSGYVAIPKGAYDALMRAHAKAEGR